MKKINNLTEYINVVENLSSIFKFNFPNGSYEDVYPDFREEDFTGEQNSPLCANSISRMYGEKSST